MPRGQAAGRVTAASDHERASSSPSWPHAPPQLPLSFSSRRGPSRLQRRNEDDDSHGAATEGSDGLAGGVTKFLRLPSCGAVSTGTIFGGGGTARRTETRAVRIHDDDDDDYQGAATSSEEGRRALLPGGRPSHTEFREARRVAEQNGSIVVIATQLPFNADQPRAAAPWAPRRGVRIGPRPSAPPTGHPADWSSRHTLDDTEAPQHRGRAPLAAAAQRNVVGESATAAEAAVTTGIGPSPPIAAGSSRWLKLVVPSPFLPPASERYRDDTSFWHHGVLDFARCMFANGHRDVVGLQQPCPGGCWQRLRDVWHAARGSDPDATARCLSRRRCIVDPFSLPWSPRPAYVAHLARDGRLPHQLSVVGDMSSCGPSNHGPSRSPSYPAVGDLDSALSDSHEGYVAGMAPAVAASLRPPLYSVVADHLDTRGRGTPRVDGRRYDYADWDGRRPVLSWDRQEEETNDPRKGGGGPFGLSSSHATAKPTLSWMNDVSGADLRNGFSPQPSASSVDALKRITRDERSMPLCSPSMYPPPTAAPPAAAADVAARVVLTGSRSPS